MSREPIPLPPDWEADEKGNTWLVEPDSGNHVAWFNLPGTPRRRLEVAVTVGNSPGFVVKVLTPEQSADEHLAAHINKNLQGWHTRRLNIDGVRCFGMVEGGFVKGDEEDDDGEDDTDLHPDNAAEAGEAGEAGRPAG